MCLAPMNIEINYCSYDLLFTKICSAFLVAPVQARSSSHGHNDIDIGPPASFNQLPQPEGDWTENYNKKQQKYNGILAGAAVFFVATFTFVSQHQNAITSIEFNIF